MKRIMKRTRNQGSMSKKKKAILWVLSIMVSFSFIFVLKLIIGSSRSDGFITVLTSKNNVDSVSVLGKSLKVHSGSGVKRICLSSVDLDDSDLKILENSGWDVRHSTSNIPEIDIFRITGVGKALYIDQKSSVVVGDLSTVFNEFDVQKGEIYHVGMYSNENSILRSEPPHPDISSKVLLFTRNTIPYDNVKQIASTSKNFQDLLRSYSRTFENENIIWKRLPVTYDFVETFTSENPILLNSGLDHGVKILRFESMNPSTTSEDEKLHPNLSKLGEWWRGIKNMDDPSVDEITLPVSKMMDKSSSSHGETLSQKILLNDWKREKHPGPYDVTQSKIEFLNHGSKFFPKFLEDMENAKSTIHIVTFGFIYGKLMKRIADLLIRKKQVDGVEVRLVVAHYGSYVSTNCNDWWMWMSNNGIEVVSHDGHPLQHWEDYDGVVGKTRWRDYSGDEWMTFEHRKMAVVDGKIAYVGGLGLEDHFYNAEDFMIRLEGEIVHDVQEAFLYSFLMLGGRTIFDIRKMIDYFPPIEKFEKKELTEVQLVHQTKDTKYQIRDKYLDLIGNAKKSIIMVMSEFADYRIMDAMCDAASESRGIDTKLITPQNSRQCVKYAQEGTYSTMINCGVKVYEFTTGELHSKMILVDDVILFAGSANVNGPGLHFNLEANILIDDSKATGVYIDLLKKNVLKESNLNRIEKYDKSLFEKVRNKAIWSLDYWFSIELPCGLDMMKVCDIFKCDENYEICNATAEIPHVMDHFGGDGNDIDDNDNILQGR